jgi:hypothetical protein
MKMNCRDCVLVLRGRKYGDVFSDAANKHLNIDRVLEKPIEH